VISRIWAEDVKMILGDYSDTKKPRPPIMVVNAAFY
jgi:hypothetical protein